MQTLKVNSVFGHRYLDQLSHSHGEGNGTLLQYSCLENPWTEEPGGLQSMGWLRVRYDWETSLSLFTFMHWRRNGNPLQCSCLENPRDGGAWWASVYRVAQSWTRLKWLSSSSSSHSQGSAPTSCCSKFSPIFHSGEKNDIKLTRKYYDVNNTEDTN